MKTRQAAASPEASRLQVAIRALVRRFSISERADVSCCGMTVAQAAALEALRTEGPQRSGELGRRLGISPSTASRNLGLLEDRGLIERVPDPQDGRAFRLRLTRRGRSAGAQVEEYQRRFALSVLDELPATRKEEVLESLEQLLGAIHRATESCCPGAFEHLVEEIGPTNCCTKESKTGRGAKR
jgi:DNA-binding MarR family transcriptional regulator